MRSQLETAKESTHRLMLCFSQRRQSKDRDFPVQVDWYCLIEFPFNFLSKLYSCDIAMWTCSVIDRCAVKGSAAPQHERHGSTKMLRPEEVPCVVLRFGKRRCFRWQMDIPGTIGCKCRIALAVSGVDKEQL